MLLTGKNIRETVLFPLVRPDHAPRPESKETKAAAADEKTEGE